MYRFLLSTATGDPNVIDPSFFNRLGEASAVLLQGICTVFAVLAIIWLCLTLVRIFLYDLPRKRAAKGQAQDVPAAPAAVPAPVAPVATATDDAELIAVITAAVAAFEAGSGSSFRVVSFHRVNK